MSKARVVALAAACAAAVLVSGCATKKYVAGEVGGVNQRVDGVESQVEDTQVKLRDHDARITQTGATATEASRTCRGPARPVICKCVSTRCAMAPPTPQWP